MKTAQVYPWLTQLQQQWQHELAQKQVPAASLIDGAQGSGVDVLVAEFARSLLCENSADSYCGLCHHCELSAPNEENLVTNHPDIHFIAPEAVGKSISVDQIRQANQWALSSSQLAGKRIIIIHPAEAMNESAANALLKTLETPPVGCYFVLITHAAHRLLPTIVSRCQVSRLHQLDKAQVNAWLLEQTQTQLDDICLSMYQDAPLAGKAFIEEGQYAQWQELLALVARVCQSHDLPLTEIHACFKQEPLQKITWLMYVFHEIEKYHFGVSRLNLPDAVSALTGVIDYQKALRSYQSLAKTKKQLIESSGLNIELIMTEFMIQLQGN
ncbi:MAG: DNA polymerase III subunit delta' C-terminal domain-containing protein [Vibrio sp.]